MVSTILSQGLYWFRVRKLKKCFISKVTIYFIRNKTLTALISMPIKCMLENMLLLISYLF